MNYEYRVHGPNDILTFGKHKGKSVKQVLEENPSYLVWANDTIQWFILENEVMEAAIEKSYGRAMRRYVDEDFSIYYDPDDPVWGYEEPH